MTTTRDTDNRTLEDVIAYQEARIEALTNRVRELELEVAELKRERQHAQDLS